MTCKSYDIPKTLIWGAWLNVRTNQGAVGIGAEPIPSPHPLHPDLGGLSLPRGGARPCHDRRPRRLSPDNLDGSGHRGPDGMASYCVRVQLDNNATCWEYCEQPMLGLQSLRAEYIVVWPLERIGEVTGCQRSSQKDISTGSWTA
jgi:hypothetical protein